MPYICSHCGKRKPEGYEFNFKLRGSWIILEKHIKYCHCSYCWALPLLQSRIHYGLNIPRLWRAPNAWYVIKWGPGRYLRWTNSWLKRFLR